MRKEPLGRPFAVVIVLTTLAFVTLQFLLLWETTGMSYTCGWAKVIYTSLSVTALAGALLIAFPPSGSKKGSE